MVGAKDQGGLRDAPGRGVGQPLGGQSVHPAQLRREAPVKKKHDPGTVHDYVRKHSTNQRDGTGEQVMPGEGNLSRGDTHCATQRNGEQYTPHP